MISVLAFSLPSQTAKGALEVVDDALEGQDARALYCALQDPSLALRNLQRENADWYLDQLSADREQKVLVRLGEGRTDRRTDACAPLNLCHLATQRLLFSVPAVHE